MGRPETEAEIRAKVIDNVETAFRFMGGNGTGHSIFVPNIDPATLNLPIISPEQYADNVKFAKQYLVSAITAQYGAMLLPSATQVMKRPYAPFDGNRWLLIMVNEEDIEAATKGREKEPLVQAVAHKAGDLNSTFADSWILKFYKDEFNASETVECGVLKTRVKWVTHDMTDSPIINKEFLDAQRGLHKYLEDLDNALAKKAEAKVRPWWRFWG